MCERDGIPPPPTPVLNLALSEIVIKDGEIKFTVNWEQPETTNGRLDVYSACLGGRELKEREIFDLQNVAPWDKNDTRCMDVEVSKKARLLGLIS